MQTTGTIARTSDQRSRLGKKDEWKDFVRNSCTLAPATRYPIGHSRNIDFHLRDP